MPYHVTIPPVRPVDIERQLWQRYAVALLACAFGLTARWALDPMLRDTVPFVTLFVGTVIAAWFGGIGPGILTAVLQVIVAQYAWVPPRYTLAIWNEGQAVAVAAYLVTSSILIWTVARMRNAERQARLDAARRQASEWALQESQHRLEIAIQSTSLGWFDWDITTGELRWSDEMQEIFGVVPHETADGQRFLAFIHPDDSAEVEAVAHSGAHVDADDKYSGEIRIVRPDGAIRWVALRGQVTFSDEPERRPVRFIGTVLDITEQKLAEHALVNAEKFAATGRLAASIAHEINNPLESVTNLLYLLGDVRDERQRRDFLALAEQELARASRVASQMLRFYREDKAETPAQIADILDSIVHDLAPRLDKHRVNVRRDYTHDLPMIRCFAGELRQVFQNLVQNAIEASPGGGNIVVRARQGVDWSSRERSSGLRITVADQGSGMQPETRARLFEPFFTTKGTSGTGLGLWISQGLVAKHGGHFLVRTSCRNRRGTVFTVFLPFEGERFRARAALRAESAA
jgi:PAS domain S-box-containing protein